MSLSWVTSIHSLHTLSSLFPLRLQLASSLKTLKPQYNQQDQINIPQLPHQKEPIETLKAPCLTQKTYPAYFSAPAVHCLCFKASSSYCAPSIGSPLMKNQSPVSLSQLYPPIPSKSRTGARHPWTTPPSRSWHIYLNKY